MKRSSSLLSLCSACALLALGACETPRDVSPETGMLVGAGGGALAGAAVGDGGVILPALGAIGGAVVGEEVAERDPVFD